ncbi:hypothetical protein [Clostridium beijerinckii]|uniref:Uncharacterized protein n=1 Tax=Clostridium beijerinckii TaxID=1520 RepID=A0AAX0B102_CLOBE|nr:hypothetical protein [Clostridium beijerinckii]NRT88888.1 hypothetical protein [Clostridium beijerinckii]NYC74343.1 hypothetical protein [Clostridium beijerinckii]
MQRYNGQLFADAQFTNVNLDVEFGEDETEIDVMPLLLKNGFDYLWKVRVMSYGSVKYLINGIEYQQNGCLYLDEVLVQTFKILKLEGATNNKVTLNLEYCL